MVTSMKTPAMDMKGMKFGGGLIGCGERIVEFLIGRTLPELVKLTNN